MAASPATICPMDTTELIKKAMEAVKAAGVPKELQATALELAVSDLRGSRPDKAHDRSGPQRARPSATKKPRSRKPSKSRSSTDLNNTVLSTVPDEAAFFGAIEKETGVSRRDLADVFHIENGRLEIKVASRNLGDNKKAQTKTVTALLAGAVFAGTSERKVSFEEVNKVCENKHCFDSSNAASSIKSTPGFSTIGSGRTQAVVTKSGWQKEFSNAVGRVLGKPEADS